MLQACIHELEQSREQGMATLLVCHHSLEGVMCGIGLTYLAHMSQDAVRLCSDPSTQPMLGERTVLCPSPQSDEAITLAQRVYKGVATSISTGCSRIRNGSCPRNCDSACIGKIRYACAADDRRMPEVVHRFACLAFSRGPSIRNMPTNPHVIALDELARHTLNECERTRQFMRFRKLCNGDYMSVFEPAANTLPFVAHHFAERMRQNRFCMVDPAHNVVAVHKSGSCSCSLAYVDTHLIHTLLDERVYSDDDAYVQAMWKHFYDSLALSGRDASQRGYDLRAHWIPKRLWANLPELQD